MIAASSSSASPSSSSSSSSSSPAPPASCGWTLARAHARSGDRIAIASYLGKSDVFDRAIAEFSERYADQNELDYGALADAAKSGRIEVETDLH